MKKQEIGSKKYFISNAIGALVVAIVALIVGSIEFQNEVKLYKYLEQSEETLYYFLLIGVIMSFAVNIIFGICLKSGKSGQNFVFYALSMTILIIPIVIAAILLSKVIDIGRYNFKCAAGIFCSVTIFIGALLAEITAIVCMSKNYQKKGRNEVLYKSTSGGKVFEKYQESTTDEQILRLKLGKIKRMFEDKLIDEDEYKRLKKKALDEFDNK